MKLSHILVCIVGVAWIVAVYELANLFYLNWDKFSHPAYMAIALIALIKIVGFLVWVLIQRAKDDWMR